MKSIATDKSDVKRSQVAAVSGSGDLIVTKKGEPADSMTRLSADDRERLALARNPKFRAIIEASRQSTADGRRTDDGRDLPKIRAEESCEKDSTATKETQSCEG